MAADAIKGFLISGTPHYIDAKYVNGTEITSGMVNSLATLKGIYVNTSNNFEVNAAVAGGEKLNLVAAQAVQIKPGIDENGKPEAVQFDCEQHGAEATEFTFKVCNGAQPKATRVVGLKVNAAELTLDNQKCNTTEFDADSIDIKVRNDKWNSGEVVGTTGPVYLKMKARAMDFRCYDHGGIALQVAGTDSNGKENKIKFESDRTSEIGATAAYCKEGGKGLEFGTFNNLHTSLYTGDYRFKGDADVYGVTRNTPVATSTGKVDYPTQADDFKDVINASTPHATWNEIIDAADKCKNLDETIRAEVARQALSGSGIDTSVFVTKSDVENVVASAISEAHIDTTGLATEEWVLNKHYIDALPEGLQYVKIGKTKGNFAVDVTGKYTYELTSPKSATTVDEYGNIIERGGRVVNYSNESFYTDTKKVYYKAGMDTTLADGVTQVSANTIVYAPECGFIFNVAPEGSADHYDYYPCSSAETSYYEDPEKFAFKAKVKNAPLFGGGTAAKGTLVPGSGLSESAISFYESYGAQYDEEGTEIVKATWERVDIWKKSTAWSINEINVNLETDSKIKLSGAKLEVLHSIDDVDYKMDSVLLSSNEIAADANEIVFEKKVSKNGDRSGQDTEFVYSYSNNVSDPEKVADFDAFKANYDNKHKNHGKTDEELQAMYDAFLAEGTTYEVRVKVSELLGLVQRVADLEARIAALEGSMVSGVTGVQGPMGPNGVDGAQGPQGNDGMNGSGQGVQGPMGPAGVDGAQGTAGESGPQGPQGPDGLTGADGAQGPQGEAGENGESGTTFGVQGPMGPAGENGLDGTQGPQGVAGENGESGTTFGVQGPMGPAGADGTQGVAGENGADGEQGPQGTGIANIYSEPNSAFGGTIYVITTDGLAAGFEYSNGAQGAQGVAGENGVDGNDGPQGPQGPVGADGAQGVAGENGANGNDGPQGPQGPDGTQGPQGTQNA